MRGPHVVLVIVALALTSVTGCGGDDRTADTKLPTSEQSIPTSAGTSDDGDPQVATSGECDPARPAEAGDYPGTNRADDVEQAYWVVVPPSYDGVKPADLYLLLPGGSGNADVALAGWGPSLGGLDALVLIADLRESGTRNVEVLRALIDEVAAEYCVDATGVYVIGSSTSAAIAGRLMFAAPDLIAAAAVGVGDFRPEGMEPTAPVPLLVWTGDVDRWGAAPAAEEWAVHNGCDSEPTVRDLGSGISWHHYEGCDATVEFYDFVGMGHMVPLHDCHGDAVFCSEYEEFDFWETASEFFDDNPLPG
jgi:poly(3-hydroxybutyrate) depolymerase